jgi:hypothetical protein
MSNEFKHKDPCTTLTQAEYIGASGDGHIFACQATGDILYASSTTVLKNLAKGAAGTILNMGGSCIPAWTASPTIGSTSWCNAGHAHAAANSGGTVSANVVSGTTLKSCVVSSSLTSVGTLTALTVDDVAINGKVVTMTGSACDTIVMTAAANGAFSLVTTDTAAAAANIVITADGTVDINSAGVLTLNSGAAINIEPESCSVILLDGTISIDAGVVTGATSITSTAFVGALTGNASGTAATVTGGTQACITTVANVVTVGALNAGSITSGFGTIDTGSSAITTTGLITGGTFSTGNSGTAKFLDGNGSHYFTLAAHATTTASVDYTWPAADGSCGQVLSTNSSGVLSWASAGGGPCQAAQSAIEDETNQDTYLPPDLLVHSPGVAKAWATITSGGALQCPDHNIACVGDTGTGVRDVNYTVAMSVTNYPVVVGWRCFDCGGYDNHFTTSSDNACCSALLIKNCADAATDKGTNTVYYGKR